MRPGSTIRSSSLLSTRFHRAARLLTALRRDGVAVAAWADVFGPNESSLLDARSAHAHEEIDRRQAELGTMLLQGPEPRLNDAETAELVTPSSWLTAVGPKGMVIADTAGYHKGPNRTEDRLTFVARNVSGSALY